MSPEPSPSPDDWIPAQVRLYASRVVLFLSLPWILITALVIASNLLYDKVLEPRIAVAAEIAAGLGHELPLGERVAIFTVRTFNKYGGFSSLLAIIVPVLLLRRGWSLGASTALTVALSLVLCILVATTAL